MSGDEPLVFLATAGWFLGGIVGVGAFVGGIVGVVLAIRRRRFADVATGLGFGQGLGNVALAARLAGSLDTRLAMTLALVQGLSMVICAVATYRGKLYGAYGLLIIAGLNTVIFLVQRGTPGSIIPSLIYLWAVVSLHRARRTAGPAVATTRSP